MEWLNARGSGVNLTSAYDASSGNNIVGVGWGDQGSWATSSPALLGSIFRSVTWAFSSCNLVKSLICERIVGAQTCQTDQSHMEMEAKSTSRTFVRFLVQESSEQEVVFII